MKARRYIVILLVFAIILTYLPSLTNFFSADDWFHLRVSNIDSWTEFLNFFSFSRTAQSIAFYRPLSTQVFFLIFQNLFGLNPVPYHIFVLTIFGFSLFLLYKLAALLFQDKRAALLSILIYGLSVSNFTRIYFLSAFQEILLVMFSLLTILNYLRGKQFFSWLFFILALMSKETAVVLPPILLVLDWSRKKINLKNFIPLVFILIIYLYFRLSVFGPAAGDTYRWNFSPVKAANTLTWYSLWSVGAPELLVDYLGSGFRPISRFFTDYPVWWIIILTLVLANLVLLIYLSVSQIKKLGRHILSHTLLFTISLSPVLFLPEHKFTLELGIPLIWFSLVVAWLIEKQKLPSLLFIFLYLSLNISMNYLTYTRHPSVQRAKISAKVYQYFKRNYPKEPINNYFEFINDTKRYTREWGSSLQISHSVGRSELFRVFYANPNYNVYYEDILGDRPKTQRLPISSKLFLQ